MYGSAHDVPGTQGTPISGLTCISQPMPRTEVPLNTYDVCEFSCVPYAGLVDWSKYSYIERPTLDTVSQSDFDRAIARYISWASEWDGALPAEVFFGL